MIADRNIFRSEKVGTIQLALLKRSDIMLLNIAFALRCNINFISFGQLKKLEFHITIILKVWYWRKPEILLAQYKETRIYLFLTWKTMLTRLWLLMEEANLLTYSVKTQKWDFDIAVLFMQAMLGLFKYLNLLIRSNYQTQPLIAPIIISFP